MAPAPSPRLFLVLLDPLYEQQKLLLAALFVLLWFGLAFLDGIVLFLCIQSFQILYYHIKTQDAST